MPVLSLQHAEACNFFGHSYKQWYKAVARHPAEPELIIWFPRFYENDEWQTWISNDEETIFECRVADNGGYVDECLDRPEMFKRLVFPAVGPGRYRFKGSEGRGQFLRERFHRQRQ